MQPLNINFPKGWGAIELLLEIFETCKINGNLFRKIIISKKSNYTSILNYNLKENGGSKEIVKKCYVPRVNCCYDGFLLILFKWPRRDF